MPDHCYVDLAVYSLKDMHLTFNIEFIKADIKEDSPNNQDLEC